MFPSGRSNSFMNTPSKLNSSTFKETATPDHLDKIENYQMDFSAVKDISDSFGSDSIPSGLRTPTAFVKSQNSTPQTNELKSAQNDMLRLRDQIIAIKSDLNSSDPSNSVKNRENIDVIVNKLSGMLESYEQVSSQYENQLKQFLLSRKASKMDYTSGRLEEDLSRLNQEKKDLLSELDKVRNELYREIQQNDNLKNQFIDMEKELTSLRDKISEQEMDLQKANFENNRVRTELDVEMTMEDERRKRALDHENELKSIKLRHDEELKQKKILISDLQNEVAFLKQSEKVLEEELNSRRFRLSQTSDSPRGGSTEEASKLADELYAAKRQIEELKKLWENSQNSKMRSEEYYRSEIERIRADSSKSDEYEELQRDLKEITGRLKQTRADNEELAWALETSRKETERLNALISEQAEKLQERDKKLSVFSDRIRDLESREIQCQEIDVLQESVKKLTVELEDEKIRSSVPLEQVSSLKRKVSLIEREKELLEEHIRTYRLAAYSQGEFQTFSSFIQGLKRHVESEILGIEPMKLTLQDVVRAKEMIDILLKVTDDVRVKVLNHLSQVEDVLRSRTSFSRPENTMDSNEVSVAETVKIDRFRNYDNSNLSDLKKRIDFRSDQSALDRPRTNEYSRPFNPADNYRTSSEMRTLREPLGVTSIPGASNGLSRSRASADDFGNSTNLENRMNNFRSLVSDLKSRQPISAPSTSQLPSQSHYHHQKYSSNNLVRAHEPIRCNLCQEYGHDALSCPDYLSGADTFSEDLFLRDVRNSKFNSARFTERTRV